MSLETYEWLANNVLAGFADERPPWWSRGDEANLYPGAVPIEDVERLLCSWEPEPFGVYDDDMTRLDWTGWRASDTKEVMTIKHSETAPHKYKDWLTGTIRSLTSDDVQISTAGMVKRRMQAWVQLEMPQVSIAKAGVRFAPYVLLSASLDASIATQANRAVTNAICDNTMNMGRGQGLIAKVKNTKNSLGKLTGFRKVIDLLLQSESDFTAYVSDLLDDSVDDKRFGRFIEALIPIDEDWIQAKRTRHQRKRQEITELYRTDERAATWKGTAWGVVQAVNTWETHMRQLRNSTGKDMDDRNLRAMTNMSAMIDGTSVSDDARALEVLASV